MWPSDCWACGPRIAEPVPGRTAAPVAVGLLGGPGAVDCWACGRRIAGPVAVEGNVDGTKIVWAQMATIENKSA